MKRFDFSEVAVEEKTECICNLLTRLAKSVTDFPVEVTPDDGDAFLVEIGLTGIPRRPLTMVVQYYEDMFDNFGMLNCRVSREVGNRILHHNLEKFKKRWGNLYKDPIETEEELREMIADAVREGTALLESLGNRWSEQDDHDDDDGYRVDRTSEMVSLLTDLAKSVTDYPVEVWPDTNDQFWVRIHLSGWPLTSRLEWYKDIDNSIGVRECWLSQFTDERNVHHYALEKFVNGSNVLLAALLETEEEFCRWLETVIEEGNVLYDRINNKKFESLNADNEDVWAHQMCERLAELTHSVTGSDVFVDADESIDFNLFIDIEDPYVPCELSIRYGESDNPEISPSFEVTRAATLCGEDVDYEDCEIPVLIGAEICSEEEFRNIVFETLKRGYEQTEALKKDESVCNL